MLWYYNAFANRNVLAHHKTKTLDLVVDLDGTVAKDAYPDIGKPEKGVKEAFEQLREAGFRIVIFTCRLNRTDGRTQKEIDDHLERMKKWFKKHEIPYDKIDMGDKGKPFGVAYIDNKGFHYGGKDDWESITKRLLAEKDSLS
jgi:phosphoglycolate phosphatase-like HAD superfamily hydrolase